MKDVKFEPVIGLEIHLQLHTKSKMFCSCAVSDGDAPPNSNICPICTGQPGVLPALNAQSVTLAIKSAVALNCKINTTSIFARKNYFYPDCPKNYQITQHERPLAEGGFIEIETGAISKRIDLERIHTEEDAGKSIHDAAGKNQDYSLVDFNRSGTPLIEIVTKPEMNSPQEAYDFLTALKSIMQWSEISNCDMEKGNLRVDVNLSLRPKGDKKLGTKVEMKNLNSFKAVKDCLNFEIKRQTTEIKEGRRIIQETRLWNEAKNSTVTMRSKEESHDYRYFPEPDLAPLQISVKTINEIKKSLPELPAQRKQRFIKEYKLSDYDGRVLTSDKNLADYFESAVKSSKASPKLISNWITTDLAGKLKAERKDITNSPIASKHIAELVSLIELGKISTKMAKEVFLKMWETEAHPQEIVSQGNMSQVSDQNQLESWAKEAIASNPSAAKDLKNGKEKAIGALVGFVMKKSKGKANPAVLNKIIKKLVS